MPTAPLLGAVGTEYNVELILCPSGESLSMAYPFLHKHRLLMGGQDCSAHPHGPHTGEILAASLKELGCSHCIIGHEETKKERSLSASSLQAKCRQALQAQLIPIICFGESTLEQTTKEKLKSITQQLKSFVPLIEENQILSSEIIFSYEPAWAIGTGARPSAHELSEAVELFDTLFPIKKPEINVRLVYGGSVDEDSAEEYAAIEGISGLMLGRTSTDFQGLKKIVSSYSITQ